MIKGPLPDKFKRNICLCKTLQGLDNSGPKPWTISVYVVCKTCKKPPAYFLYECSYCTNVFLHDFYQNFCYKSPLCWTCNTDNVACREHIYCTTHISDNQRISPLHTLKPAFTPEEMADFSFDF